MKRKTVSTALLVITALILLFLLCGWLISELMNRETGLPTIEEIMQTNTAISATNDFVYTLVANTESAQTVVPGQFR